VLALAILLRRTAQTDASGDESSSADAAALSVAEARLAAAEQQWREHGPANYELIIRETCFCPTRPLLRVTVHGSGLGTELVPPESGSAAETGQPASPYSVPTLFAEIRQTLADTDWVIDVSYDSVLGYPKSLSTSHRRITDIGHGVQVLSLTPLSR
jgi:hypothetical protein